MVLDYSPRCPVCDEAVQKFFEAVDSPEHRKHTKPAMYLDPGELALLEKWQAIKEARKKLAAAEQELERMIQ